MRRVAPILLVIPCLSAPALGAGLWDFYGGGGLYAGRTDNPNIQTTTATSSARRGDIAGSLRLTGGARAQWERTQFEVTYSPSVSLFYERSDLNQISHSLTSTWRHAYTPRTSLSLGETISYTPEQDIDPSNLQQNNILLRRTSRTSGNLRAGYSFTQSPKTSYSWNYRYQIRSFSSDDFIDTSNHNVGINWRRRIAARSYITSGYDYGIFMFDGGGSNASFAASGGSPGSQHHAATVGYGFEAPNQVNFAFSAGYNILVPEASSQEPSSGLALNSSVGWSGNRLGTAAGYSRGFTDGAGAFATAETQTVYTNLRFTFTPALSADLAATRNVHENTAATVEQTVRTVTGRASLTYSLGQSWGIAAAFTHSRQRPSGFGISTGSTGLVPEIRTNRYTLGITWSVR